MPFAGLNYSLPVNGVRTSSHPIAGQTKVFRRGASAPDSVRKSDALDLIEQNWDRFDRDGNGSVSWKEMRANVADPTIQGKDAAALATLYSLVSDSAGDRGLIRNPPATRDFLYDLKDDRDMQIEEGEDQIADLYYQRYLSKLENASNELFVGLPNAFQVAQGYGPSCAILATTAAQARINPAVIQEAIKIREDGKVEVKFPGVARPEVIAPTTDTETALFASAGKNGTWLNHIEKAWGAMQGSDPGAAFEQSSWPAKSIRAWSGAKAETFKIPSVLDTPHKSGELPEFLRDVLKELASNHIVMTWTRNGERELGNLVPRHAHTLTGIDPDRGVIEVRQPWGHREPLDKNGNARDGRDDGVFEVTLQEFVKDFDRISMQTTTPKRRDAALLRSPAGTKAPVDTIDDEDV